MVPLFAAFLLLIAGYELGSSQAFFLNGSPENVHSFDEERQKILGTPTFQHFPSVDPRDFRSDMYSEIKETSVSAWQCYTGVCWFCFDVSSHNVCVVVNLSGNGVLGGYGVLEKKTFLASQMACDTMVGTLAVPNFPEIEAFAVTYNQLTFDKDSASTNVTVTYYLLGKWTTKPLGTVRVHQ